MIGETVKKLRERKGLSQKELGKMVGASQQNLAQLENNEVKQPRYLPSLAKALGLSIEGLYSIAEGADPEAMTIMPDSTAEPKATYGAVTPAHKELTQVLQSILSRHPQEVERLTRVLRAFYDPKA